MSFPFDDREELRKALANPLGDLSGGLPYGSSPSPAVDEGFYPLVLPDGLVVQARQGSSEADAYAQAMERFPDSFTPAIQGMSVDSDSSPLDAFLSTAARTTRGIYPGLKAAYASAVGDEEMYDAAQREIEEASLLAAEIAPSLTSTSDISNLWERGEYASSVGKAFEFGTEQIGSSFGFQVPAAAAALGGYGLAAAGLAGGIAAPVLATLAGLGAMYATFLSSDIERAMEAGARDTDDLNLLRVMSAAGGQTALNSLSYLMVGGGAAAKGVLGAGLSKEGKDIALGSFGKMLNKLDKMHPVKQAAAVLLEEEVAEVGQQALERMAAGLEVSPANEQAMDEYVQIMLATLAPGVGFGGGRAAVSAFNNANALNEEGYATKLKALSGESNQIAREHFDRVKLNSAASFQDLADSINEETVRLSSLEEDKEAEVSSRYVEEAITAANELKADVAAGRATQARLDKVSKRITRAKAAEYESYVKRISARDKIIDNLSASLGAANQAERARIESEIESRNKEIQKIRNEMEAAQAAEDVLSSSQTEASRQAATDRVSQLRSVSREDITETLESRNISYDNDPAFMIWMSQLRGPDGKLIGKYEIDALDPDQRRHVLRVVEEFPVQQVQAELYGASPQSAQSVFTKALAKRRGSSSPLKIAKILNLPSKIDAKTRRGITEKYFLRMKEMGLVEKRGENYYAKTGLNPALEEQYSKVAPLVRNGQFPSFEEIVQKTDISDPDVAEELRLAFIARGGLPYTPKEFSKEYRLSVDGEVDQTRSFSTLAEAQGAANSELTAGTKAVEVLDLEERLRIPSQLRQATSDKSVEIVERDAPYDGIAKSEYKVSSKPTGAWEVLDSSGNRVALRSSKKKADSFINGSGPGRVDVIVNDQKIGSARNQPQAQKLRADWIASRRSEVYDQVYESELSNTRNLEDSVYTRESRLSLADRAAKKAADRVDAEYKTKYDFVPNGFTVNKVDGYTVTERRLGQDGRSSDPRITEIFPSRDEADSYVSDSIAAVSGPRFFEGQEVSAVSLLKQLEFARTNPESATSRRLSAVREVQPRATRPFPAEDFSEISSPRRVSEFPVDQVPVVEREQVGSFPAEDFSAADMDALAVARETQGKSPEEIRSIISERAARRTLEETGESPVGPFGAGRRTSKGAEKSKDTWRQGRLRPEAEQSVIARLDSLVEGVESGAIQLDPESEFAKKYEQQKLSQDSKNILFNEAAIESPGDRAEWIDGLDKEVQAISSRMGLPVKVKLYEKKGAQESAAEFLTESMVVQIAVDSNLEGKTTQEQLAAIEPFLNHEFVHVSRRLGLIKASEWSKLTDYVEKTPISSEMLSRINAAQRAVGGPIFEEGTTYLDYAFKAYGSQGTHQLEAIADKAAFDRGELTAAEYSAIRAEREKRNWIRDDYVEEAVARLFQDYTSEGQINLPAANQAAPDVEKSVLKRILNWFRQVGNTIKKRGNPSVTDILSTFATEGELSKRLDRGKALDTWWLRRVDGAEYERLRNLAIASGNKFPDPQIAERLIGEQAKAEGKDQEGSVQPEGRSAEEFAIAWVSDGSKTSPETRRAIDVFHGTPYIWKINSRLGRLAPDLHRVGTGEGPQAFSWGFYTAESPEVAEGYRDSVSARRGTAGGAVYGLTIDESESSLLDLDRSVSEQSVEVQRILLDMGLIQEGDNLDALNGQDMYVRLVNQFQSPSDAEISGSLIGESEANPETLRAASETMLESGIPGVRYLDGKSRPAEAVSNTRNYVMFSEDNIYVDPVRTDASLTEEVEIGSPSRTVNDPVLAPRSADPRNLRSSDEEVGLDSYTWGEFPANRFGNTSKPSRVIVKEGYATRLPGTGELSGMGKRFLDSSTRDVQRNTTFSNWEDLVAGAFERLNPVRVKSGEFSITSPTEDRVVLVWNDPRFENPASITLDYVKDRNSDVSGNPDNDYWSVVGLRADGRYSLPAQPYQPDPSLRGPDVSASAVVASERPESVAPASAREIKRYSLESSTAKHDPATEQALDTVRGDLPRPRKSLWQLATSGLPDISNDTIDRFRQLFFDKYNRLWRAGLMLGDRGDVVQLADSSAHAAALQIDRSSAYFARMLMKGGIEFQRPPGNVPGSEFDGTPVVTDLNLTNQAQGVVVGFNPEDLSERRTIDVSLSPDKGYKVKTGGLIPILQLIGTPDNNLTDEFFMYARALRALRLKSEGRATGKEWPDSQIAEILKLAEVHPELGVVHRNLQAWNNKLVDFLEATQAIPSWMAEEWKRYGDYTPFYQDLSNMEDSGGVGDTLLLSLFGSEFDNETSRSIANSLVTGEPSKKLKNATGMNKMMSPIEAISKNAMRLITVGLKNNARNRAIRDQEILGAVNLADGERNSLARKLGENESYEGSVKTLRNGEEERWYIADRMTQELLEGSFNGNNPGIESFSRILSMPANVLREGVTRAPDFILRNLQRDSINAWQLGLDAPDSPGGAPLVGALKRYGKNLRLQLDDKATEEYNILQDFGAIGGYELLGISPKKLQRIFQSKIEDRTGAKQKLWNIWDKWGEASARSESTVREQVYLQVLRDTKEKLRKKGYSDQAEIERLAMSEAAFQAMEILNFSRRGSSTAMQLFTAGIPFLNARLQGLDRLYRAYAYKESPNSALSNEDFSRILKQRLLILASISAAMAVWNYGDEDYEDLRKEKRDDNWMIMLPKWGGEGSPRFFSIPISFENGIMAKIIPEQIARSFMKFVDGKETGEVFSDVGSTMWRQLVSTLLINPLGFAALHPANQALVTNWDNFRDTQVVPQWMKDSLDPEYQRRSSTGSTAQNFRNILDFASAGVIDLSPIQIEHLVRGYGGTLGMYALMSSDFIADRLLGGIDFPIIGEVGKAGTPLQAWTSYPAVRSVIQTGLGGGQKAKFYEEAANELNRVVGTLNAIKEEGNPRKFAQYVAENRGLLSKADSIRDIRKILKEVREAKESIIRRGGSVYGKREKLDRLRSIERDLISRLDL